MGAAALSTLLNPKVGLFYLAVVPQFIPHGGDTMGTSLILGVVVAVTAFAYLSMIAGLGVGVVASGAAN